MRANESAPIVASNLNRNVLLRSLGLPVLVLGALLLWVLGVQALLSWHALQRLNPVEYHMARLTRLQKVNVKLQRELVWTLVEEPGHVAALERLRTEISDILRLDGLLSSDTPRLLQRARQALADPNLPLRDALVQALSSTRDALDQETGAHEALIRSVQRTAALELQLGLVALLAFPLLVLGLLYLLRQRILAPLQQLSSLMGLIARRDYSSAPTAGVDPLLLPLTESYNHMASRLSLLEAERLQREQDLEAQVREAAHALLAQSRTLARADRLAAVGESMARVAHELRNPLAGVKLACANLEADLADPEHKQRLFLVMDELDRVVAVLNALLDQARHKPESARPVALARSVDHLLRLLRYQVPAAIALRHDGIPENLVCRLPEAMLQQALLNLVLNAAQALGDAAGEICIRAHVADERLTLSVQDDGPGFPEALLAQGVRPFASQRAGGTGLGLAMAQRFARALGGELKLANAHPRGALATLELPCSHA